MSVSVTGVIPPDGYRLFFTWLHIITGLSFWISGTLLIVFCFRQRGIKHYYPWAFGYFSQITTDCRALLRGKLPESSSGGLATTVQGLGLGALALVVLSGTAWFILWAAGSVYAGEIRNLHKTLTGLIETYIIGHGAMGLLHFILWLRGKNTSGNNQSG
nr:cytochrome b/b6 domain-containing protein [Morganella morganii]